MLSALVDACDSFRKHIEIRITNKQIATKNDILSLQKEELAFLIASLQFFVISVSRLMKLSDEKKRGTRKKMSVHVSYHYLQSHEGVDQVARFQSFFLPFPLEESEPDTVHLPSINNSRFGTTFWGY